MFNSFNFLLVPQYDIVNIHHINKRSISDSNHNSISNNLSEKTANNFEYSGGKSSSESKQKDNFKLLKFHAFGQPVNLSLTKHEGLVKKGGLKLFSVEPNATAQHGVEYVEILPEVIVHI